VKDKRDAGESAITAGSDMDMESHIYIKYLAQLVKDKKMSIALIDDAVRRILRKKFELGLFENPYKFCDTEREQRELNDPEHRIAARDIARKSIVLLKNENQLLPLNNTQKVALIGPLAKSKEDMFGYWSVNTDTADVVSQYEGLKQRIGDKNIYYAKGCAVEDTSKVGFADAIAMAKLADVVVLSVGETKNISGESKSRSNINLPGVQDELIKAIYQTGKPIVILLNTGRPLVFDWTADHVPAILCTWLLGSEAGNAIADVLYGNYNPSGKLPMTFPRSVGQIPIYYNILPTGHPAPDVEAYQRYTVGYLDLQKSPKFPFGFGLSYTTFGYSDLKMSSSKMKDNENIDISFILTNNGKYAGEEVTQLYLRDKVASVSRPIKELKGFQKIMLQVGESKTIHFTINKEKLSFFNNKLEWVAEPGEFDIMIGSSSNDIRIKGMIELSK
jgi:beta-glucosidase